MITDSRCEQALNGSERHHDVPRDLINDRRGLKVLLAVIAAVLTTTARADIATKSPQELTEIADEIVLGVVESRSMAESTNGSWLERDFTYQVRVEDGSEKGDLERGDVIQVRAANRRWTGSDPMPPSGTGHSPLPIVGELARFHLVRIAGEDAFMVVLPNGVELSMEADLDDPTRGGDPAPPEIVDPEPTEPTAKDPFGWDVILLLLAIPLVVGSLRQRGRPRWILLSIAFVMLLGAIAIVVI